MHQFFIKSSIGAPLHRSATSTLDWTSDCYSGAVRRTTPLHRDIGSRVRRLSTFPSQFTGRRVPLVVAPVGYPRVVCQYWFRRGISVASLQQRGVWSSWVLVRWTNKQTFWLYDGKGSLLYRRPLVMAASRSWHSDCNCICVAD